MGKMSPTICRALPTPGKFSNVDRYDNRKYCRSTYYRASEKWNNLNVNLTLIDDKKVFKRLLLNSYENIYVDPVNE